MERSIIESPGVSIPLTLDTTRRGVQAPQLFQGAVWADFFFRARRQRSQAPSRTTIQGPAREIPTKSFSIDQSSPAQLLAKVSRIVLTIPCSSPISCGGDTTASSISARSRSSCGPPSGETGGRDWLTFSFLTLPAVLRESTSAPNFSASTCALRVADFPVALPVRLPSTILPPAASIARRAFW